jgi:hypothetical protein
MVLGHLEQGDQLQGVLAEWRDDEQHGGLRRLLTDGKEFSNTSGSYDH